jgi:hypothetical protein
MLYNFYYLTTGHQELYIKLSISTGSMDFLWWGQNDQAELDHISNSIQFLLFDHRSSLYNILNYQCLVWILMLGPDSHKKAFKRPCNSTDFE